MHEERHLNPVVDLQLADEPATRLRIRGQPVARDRGGAQRTDVLACELVNQMGMLHQDSPLQGVTLLIALTSNGSAGCSSSGCCNWLT